MRVVGWILIPVLVLVLCIVVMLWLPLPAPFPPALSSGRNRAVAAIAGLAGLVYLVALVLGTMAWFHRAGRDLDPVFGELGMDVQRYQVVGREYRGTVEGRQVRATYMPAWGLHRALLTISVQSAADARLAWGRTRPLLDCRDCPVVLPEGPSWTGVVVVAENKELARRLMTEVSAARLADGGEVYIQPGRIWLRARGLPLTAGLVQDWLADLLVLAEAVERVSNLAK